MFTVSTRKHNVGETWAPDSFFTITIFSCCKHSAQRRQKRPYEPSDEIMVFAVFHKLILQTRMRSHLVGLDVWFLVGLFIYFHT